MRTNKLTIIALAMAAVAVVTMFLKVPLPASQGYFNLGEAVIYLVAFLFGAPAAALAGGVGAALADLWGGYYFYAPVTLIVKGLEGWVVGRLAPRSKVLAVFCGALILMAGYGTAAFVLTRQLVPVLWELGIDFLQAFTGALIAIPLSRALKFLGEKYK